MLSEETGVRSSRQVHNTKIRRLRDVLLDFELILIDVWGVILEGEHLASEARRVLEELQRAGCVVMLLSNTARRSPELYQMLSEKGLSRSLYLGAVTSGDLVFEALSVPDGKLVRLGRRCCVIGEQPGSCWVQAIGLENVAEPERAQFVLATGLVGEFLARDEETDFLLRCLEHNLPLVVANPDQAVRIRGELCATAGAVGTKYKSLGGVVHEFGKPKPDMFVRALKKAGIPSSRSVMLGDSVETDVVGAQAIGVRAVLLLNGGELEKITNNAWPHVVSSCTTIPGLIW